MDAVGGDADAGPDNGGGGLDGGDDDEKAETKPEARRVDGFCGGRGGRGRKEGAQEEGDERDWEGREI